MEINEAMESLNNYFAYIIGVDEAGLKITGGEITCKFTKDSKRYNCMKMALSLIDEYRRGTKQEGRVLLGMIKDVRELFIEAISKANHMFKGISAAYDDETQDVINQLDDILKENNII